VLCLRLVKHGHGVPITHADYMPGNRIGPCRNDHQHRDEESQGIPHDFDYGLASVGSTPNRARMRAGKRDCFSSYWIRNWRWNEALLLHHSSEA